MLVQVKKLIVKSYADLFKDRFENILADIVLLIMTISCMITADSIIKDATITLFDITYRLDLLVFYLMAFVFVLTTSSLFKDIRAFLNILSKFIITRFPRMQGDFTPGMAILRDFVQVILLMLVFYPVSMLAGYSYRGFFAAYIVSVSFVLLTLIFAYDILSNIIKVISESMQAMTKKVAEENAAPVAVEDN